MGSSCTSLDGVDGLAIQGGGLDAGSVKLDAGNASRDASVPGSSNGTPSEDGGTSDASWPVDGRAGDGANLDADAGALDAGETDTGSGTVNGGDGATLAPLAKGDLRVYFADSAGRVSLRTRSGSTWSNALPVLSSSNGGVSWVDPALAPSSLAEGVELAPVANGGGAVTLEFLERALNWSPAFSATGLAPSLAAHRDFDVVYETVSGDALSVYSNGGPNPAFRTRVGQAWSAPQPVFAAPPGSAAVDWILLVPHPSTDEVTLLYSDTTPYLYAAVWNGTSWSATSTTALDTTGLNVPDFPAFSAAYGATSGDFLAVWSRPSSCQGAADPLYYATRANGATAFSAPQTSGAVGAPGVITVASEPGSARIAIAINEYAMCCMTSSCNDFSAAMWNGSTFTEVVDLDSNSSDYAGRAGSVPVSVGWVGTTGTAVAVYAHSGGTLNWATWTSGSGWSLQTPATMTPSLSQQMGFQIRMLPSSGELALLIEDVNGALWAKSYDGTQWSDLNGGAFIASSLWASSGRPFGALVGP